MPGQDQYVKLPDGTYVHVPGSATPQQLSQLRDKLSSLQPNLKTGQGMEAAAHRQATPKPGELPGVPSGPPPTGNAGTVQAPLVTPQPGESYTDTLQRGIEMGRRVTPRQIGTATDTGIREAPAVIAAASAPSMVTGIAEGVAGGVPSLLKLGRAALGGTAGGIAGAGAGGKVGSYFGDTGRKIGEGVGGLAGGLIGGGMASALERQPATAVQRLAGEPGRIGSLPFGIQRFMPDWMVPGPSEDALAATQARAQQEQLGSFMNKGYRNVGTPPSQRLLGAPETEIPDVIHAPITSESNWLQRPEGNIQNVSRDQIPGLIQRTGDPAAVKEARRLGSTVLYVPEEY